MLIVVNGSVWTIVSIIAAVIGAIVALLSVLWHRQKQNEILKQSCIELCDSISVGEINAVLNNAIAIINKKEVDSNGLIAIQNQLQSIVRDVNAKWNRLKMLLLSSRQNELSEKMESIIQEYLFCLRDVETVVSALGCDLVNDIERLVSEENSIEMRSIMEVIIPLYSDVYELLGQIVALRFSDLEILDYAEMMHLLWDAEHRFYDNVFTRLRAAIGNPNAQLALGDYYYFEHQQFNKAFYWYLKSARQGLAQAQYNTGSCYANGVGVEKDEKIAFEWCKKSAEQGYDGAQLVLGVFYLKGEVIEKDEKKAFEWCKKAAEQGCAEAQYFLGQCYRYGIGVEKDEKRAFEWYKKSAEQGFADAQHSLGVCYFIGIGVDNNELYAFVCYKIAAEKGVAHAQHNLAVCYENGYAVKKDEKKAFEWYKKAAEQGFDQAQYNLGFYYEKGFVVEKDEQKAFEWYKRSAEQGCTHAQIALGNCYDYGKGCEQDFAQAYYWYYKASENQGDVELYRNVMYRIGMLYESGKIGFGSVSVAVDYYNIAAQYGFDLAQCRLGCCYEKGKGVKEIDIEKAKFWYKKAAEQNNKEALAALARLDVD